MNSSLHLLRNLVLWSHGYRMQGWHPEASCQEEAGTGSRRKLGDTAEPVPFSQESRGEFPAVQHWLSGFTAVSWVQSLVRELRWPKKIFNVWSSQKPRLGISPNTLLARNGSLYTLKLQETAWTVVRCLVQSNTCWYLKLNQSSVATECGVVLGKQLTRLPLRKFVNAFTWCLAHKST